MRWLWGARLQTPTSIIISKCEGLLQSNVNNTVPKLVHFCLRAQLFTWLLYKCTDLSGRNPFEVKAASADKRCVSFLFFFRPTLWRLTQKSVWGRQLYESVLRDSHESVYCSLLCGGFILVWQTADAGCRLTATALLDSCWRDNVQLTILPFPPPLPYVGGWHGWSHSSGSWSHVNVRLVAFYCLSLFDYRPGWLQTFLPSDRRAIKSDPSQLPTLPSRKIKWLDLASNVVVFLKTSLSRCSPSA